MKPLADCRLYAFVDTAWLQGRSAEFVAQELCAGGADLIQFRAKNIPAGELTEMAAAVANVTRAAGVGLVINDHPEAAAAVGAEFCHLGQEDFFDAGFRTVSDLPLPNPRPGIGLSTHSPEQAQRAIAAGPAYVAIGPVYPTDTKPTARPVTLEYVRWAAVNVTIPWFAIGGINLQNLSDVLAAGATRICVVSAILNAPDIAAACREFKKRLP
jgi:thiamine-phosphate pyrophosphorylase